MVGSRSGEGLGPCGHKAKLGFPGSRRCWCGLLLGYQWYAWRQDLSTLEAVQHLIDFMSSGLAGPLIYVVFYALRPLVLFPASLLTWAAGFVFGPVLGLLFTVLGSNISASVAYLAGRYFGGSFQNTGYTLQGYAERLHGNSFESVLIMRLIFVPFDAVNYAVGLLHVRYRPFILATILGSLPGTTAFVLFGASMQGSFRRNAAPRPLDPSGFGADRRRKPPSIASP